MCRSRHLVRTPSAVTHCAGDKFHVLFPRPLAGKIDDHRLGHFDRLGLESSCDFEPVTWSQQWDTDDRDARLRHVQPQVIDEFQRRSLRFFVFARELSGCPGILRPFPSLADLPQAFEIRTNAFDAKVEGEIDAADLGFSICSDVSYPQATMIRDPKPPPSASPIETASETTKAQRTRLRGSLRA